MSRVNTVLIVAAIACVAALTVSAAVQPESNRPAANAALRYWMAMAELRDLPPTATTTRDVERVLDGRQDWDEASLGPLVEANQAALGILRRGATLVTCDWGLEWELGPETPVAHLPKARVLGRLAALAASRAHARGQADLATDLWRTGVTFSTHVARDGSLVSMLTARAILVAQLRTARHASATHVLPPQEADRLRTSVKALPVGAFQWDAAIAREADSVRRLIERLRASRDMRGDYKRLTGEDLPAGKTMPTEGDVRVYLEFMRDLAAVLREAPASAAAQMRRLESARGGLHPLLQDSVPVLNRILQDRATLEADRLALLAALAAR